MTEESARILVVDDDPIMLRLASRVLREGGHQVITASCGEEALRLAEEEAPDLMVLDIVLPDIDGVEVCRRIKGDSTSREIYVILMSGRRTESGDQATGLEAGADGYIARPVSNRELLARVEAMLRLKRAEDALRRKAARLEQEVVERRRLERESERRRLYLEATLESAPSAIITLNRDHEVLEWNRAAEELFGYREEEVVGRGLDALVTHSDEDALEEASGLTEQLLAGEAIPPLETVRYRKDGRAVNVIVAGAPIVSDDEVLGVIGIYRDISERKAYERELGERRAYLEAILETSPAAIVTLDREQRVVDWNERTEALFGYRADEAIGRELDRLVSGPDGDVLEEAKEFTERVEAGGIVPAIETVRYRKDGTPVHVILGGAPIVLDGAFAGAFVVYTDISEQKRIERRLRESEIRFRQLFNRMSSGVAIYRPKDAGSTFIIEDMNLAGQRASRVNREEVVGREVRDVFPGVEEMGLFEVLQDVHRSGTPRHHPVTQYEDERISQWVENYVFKLQTGEVVAVYEDVTEQKRMEEALRESEEQYRSLFNSIRDAILVADTDRNIIDCNPAFSELFGYTLDEIEGKPTYSVYESREEFEALGEALQDHIGDPSFLFTVRYQKKSGAIFPGETNVFYLRNDEGDVTGFIGLIRDVTERQRMEKELRESRERYRNLVENQGEGVAIVTPTERFTFANPAAHEIFGMPRGELIGHDLREFLDEEGMATVATQTERRRAGERSTYELEIVRPDGEGRTILVTASPRQGKGGRFEGTLAVFRDITERKRLEELLRLRMRLTDYAALHSLGELLQQTLDEICAMSDSPIGFYHFVEEDQNTIALQAWSTRTLDEFCTAQGVGLHNPLDEAGVWADCVRQGGPVIHNDYASLVDRKGLPDGHVEVVREVVVPVFRGGRVVAIVGVGNKPWDYTKEDVEVISHVADVAWEIAQRKQAEEELERHHEQLEEMVEERTRRLQDAQEKLLRRQKLATLGQLAGSINHELRGPLGNIKSGAYFLDMALEEPEEEVEETVALLQREVDRAESIVSSLLNFVRTQEPQREEVDVQALIEEVVSRAEIPKGVDVSWEGDEELPTIWADQEQLQQAFRNLISNGIEAMPEGGRLTIEATRGSEREILVSITDTGRGIPEEHQERIFEPLFSTKSGGVGLGLALTRMLVEAHGGTVEVESEEGAGSTFRVRLPTVREQNGNRER